MFLIFLAQVEQILDTLAASGPLALILGVGLYFVAKWGMRAQKRNEELADEYADRIKEMRECCKKCASRHADHVERVIKDMQDKLDEVYDKHYDLMCKLIPKLENVALPDSDSNN